MISSSNGKHSSSLHLTRRGRGRCFLLICFVGAAVLYLSGVTHLLSEPPTTGPYVSPPTEEGAPLTTLASDVVILGAQVSTKSSKAGSTKEASSWSKRWSIVTRQDHAAALWPVKGCPQQSASMVAVSNVWSRAAAGSHFRQVLSKTCGGSCRYARGEESQNPSAPWFCTDDENKRNKFVAPAAQIPHDFSGVPFVSASGGGNNGDANVRCGDDGSDMGAINPEVALQAASAVEPLPTVLHVVFCAMGERFQGPGGQSYVVESIKQWRLFHPVGTSVIHLVMDRAVAQSDPLIAGLIQHEKQLWKWGGVMEAAGRSSYKEGGGGGRMVVVTPNFIVHYTDTLMKASTEWRRYHKYFYVQGYMHPGGSRTTGNKQFNQLVSERFFAVEALMRTQNLTNVLHLENDITVYDNFVPMVHATMRCGYDMATTVIHIKGVIPSVLYVRSADALARFTAYLTEFLRCGPDFGKAIQKGYANDMTYLKNFYQLFGSRALGIFPTWKHKHGELCINTALETLRTAAASSGVVTNKVNVAAGESEGGLGVGNGLGPLFELYGLLMDRIRDQANMLVTGGEQGVSPPSSSQEQQLPSAVSAPNGVLLDGASFGQWYSSVAVADPSYLFFKGSVDVAREKGRKVVPPEHVRNSVADKRFLDATPPQVMVWEPYMSSAKLMVPSWNGYRISTLHVHQKNLNLFGSLHPRLTAGWDTSGNATTGAHHG